MKIRNIKLLNLRSTVIGMKAIVQKYMQEGKECINLILQIFGMKILLSNDISI